MAAGWDESMSGAQAVDAAVVGGEPQGAGEVAAEVGGGQVGGDCCGGASGGAAGGVLGVVRVERGAEQDVVGVVL